MKYLFEDLPVYVGSVKELPIDEQPREKLKQNGAAHLSESELIAILLRTGSAKMNVLDTSKFLLKSNGGLMMLFRKNWNEMAQIPGIGPIKALTLEAAFELGRRVQQKSLQERVQFLSPEDVAKYFIPILRDAAKEQFLVICVDGSNRLINFRILATGTRTGCHIDISDVLKEAVLNNSHNVFIIHNHPSGALQASESDKLITKRIRKALDLIGVKLLDHLIIGGNEYLSFSEKNIID